MRPLLLVMAGYVGVAPTVPIARLARLDRLPADPTLDRLVV